MRATSITAGVLAGIMMLVSVFNTVTDPFVALGQGGATTNVSPTVYQRTGEFYYDTPNYDPTISHTAPSAFSVTWKYVTMPNRDASSPEYDEYYGYVLEHGNGIKDPNNSLVILPTLQVQYIDRANYTEVFDLRGFDPSTPPELFSITSTLKMADPARAALYASVNQARTDDYNRKKAAYDIWKITITPTEAPTNKYPDTPTAYTTTWDSIFIPNTNKNDPNYNAEYGYVLEQGLGVKDINNNAVTIPTQRVQYVEVINYTETFDFTYFDPSVQPKLLIITDVLKRANPARAALYESINEAILSDHQRKVNAFYRWRNEVAQGTYNPIPSNAYEPTEPATTPKSTTMSTETSTTPLTSISQWSSSTTDTTSTATTHYTSATIKTKATTRRTTSTSTTTSYTTSIQPYSRTIEMKVGETKDLPNEGRYDSWWYGWEPNNGIANVDSGSGRVTALAPGTIKVYCGLGRQVGEQVYCIVTVIVEDATSSTASPITSTNTTASTTTTTTTTTSAPSVTPHSKGEVNGDSVINAKDASAVLIAAAKIGTGNASGLSYEEGIAADVNSDGSINAKDANSILRYAAVIGTGVKAKITDYI